MSISKTNGQPKKIRVLHIVGGMDRAGAETWLYNVRKCLSKELIQMDFVVHGNKTYDYEEELTMMGCEFIRCTHAGNPVYYTASLFRALKKRPKYDIIHAHIHYYSGFALVASRLAGIRALVCHSHIDKLASMGKPSLMQKTYQSIMRTLINKLSLAKVAVSQNAGADLFGAKWKPIANDHIIPCGIDITKYKINLDAATTKKQLKLPEESVVIGHVGRLERQKNHTFLLKAFHNARSLNPKLHLLCIGQGSLIDQLKLEADRLGISENVTFTGAANNVTTIMQEAMDGFVFPSLFEGIPLALVEAQAAGLYTIMSDSIPSQAEVYPGSTVRLSLSEPVEIWARHISQIDGSEKTGRQMKALKAIKERGMDVTSTAEKILAIYINLITY